MKRRQFVRGAGAVTVLVVGGGVWRAHDRGVWSVAEGPAYEPWHSWRTDGVEGPLNLVRAGILAANPHNTQPWLFRVQDARITLLADTERNLGSFDPYRREMFLGLGCALENMMLAAGPNGYEATVVLASGRLNPPSRDGPAIPVATLSLAPSYPAPNALYDAIPDRHTDRGPYYASRHISPEALAALQQAVESTGARVVFISDPDARARFGELKVSTTENIIADAEMVRDSERWYRHTREEVERHRDGPTLDAAGLPPVRTAMAKLLPRPSAEENHAYWLENTRDTQVATAPVFGMILVDDLYDREQTLQAGRAWQGLHLASVRAGLAAQPLNQPVELVDRERSVSGASRTAARLSAFIPYSSGEPTFAFRIGHPQRAASPSPRRGLDDVVI